MTNPSRSASANSPSTSGKPPATALRADLIAPEGLTRLAVQDTERPSPPLAAPPARLRLESSDGYLPCRAIASLAYSFIATRRVKEIAGTVACHGLLAA